MRYVSASGCTGGARLHLVHRDARSGTGVPTTPRNVFFLAFLPLTTYFLLLVTRLFLPTKVLLFRATGSSLAPSEDSLAPFED